MGLGDYNSGGSGKGVKFLKIANGAIWDKKGEEFIDENKEEKHPNWHSEEFTVAGETKIRSGHRYGYVAGLIESATFKEGNFGETLDVYLRDLDQDDLYCLQIDIKGGFGKYNVAKKVMIGLMSANLELPLTIHTKSTEVSDTFSFDDVWITQQDKRLVLNNKADAEFFDPEKQTAMPIEVKTLLDEVKVTSKEEMKAIISPDKKARKRMTELEQIQDIFNALVGDALKFEGKKDAPAQTEPTTEAPAEETQEEAPKESEPTKTLSPQERIKQMREAAAKKKA